MTGGTQTLINVAHALTPALKTVTLAVGIWGVTALATSQKLQTLFSSIPGWLRLVAGIGVAQSLGQTIGESLGKWATSGQDAVAKANEQTLSAFKSSQAEMLRTQEETDKKRVQSALQAIAQQSKAYQADLGNIRTANDTMVAMVSASITHVVKAREKAVQELRHTVDSTEQIVKSSVDRIGALIEKRQEREFTKSISGLEDPQQAVAMGQRAEELARKAAEDMAKAFSPAQIENAVRGFDKASQLAERAVQLAEKAEDPYAARTANKALEAVTSQQMTAEASLQLATLQRQPALERQLATEEQKLAVVKAQAKLIEDNLSLFDKAGALSEKDLEDRTAKALEGFPIELRLEVGQSIGRIKTQLDQAFESYKRSLPIDVGLLEAATGKPITTGQGITAAIGDVAKQTADLQQAMSQYATYQKQIEGLKEQIVTARQGADSRWWVRSLGGTEVLDPFLKDLDRVAAGSRVTREDLDRLLGELTKVKNAASGIMPSPTCLEPFGIGILRRAGLA